MLITYPEAQNLYLNFANMNDMSGPFKVREPAPRLERPDTLMVFYDDGELVVLCRVIDYLALMSNLGAMLAVLTLVSAGNEIPDYVQKYVDKSWAEKYPEVEDLFALFTQPDHPDLVIVGKLFDQHLCPIGHVTGMKRAYKQYQELNHWHFWSNPAGCAVIQSDLSSLIKRFGDARKLLRVRGQYGEHLELCANLLDLLKGFKPQSIMMVNPERAGILGLPT